MQEPEVRPIEPALIQPLAISCLRLAATISPLWQDGKDYQRLC